MSDTGPEPEEPRSWPADPGGEPGPANSGRGRGDWPQEAGRTEEDPAARISELEDRWRRALADLDNYRKRAVRALDLERSGERARTAAEWLPVLDNLERALEHADAEPGAVIQGVRSVLEQARDVIGRLGFPRREDEGEPFDPTRQEAVGTVADSGAPDGTVVRVLRPGYGEGETQLRPAQVLVAKGGDDAPAP
ncbi:MAG: GrpE protein [Actinoallomurus sp.]|jgi:molecular chaperone GrpE|nr:GrpE protein [Actinoallomurus sp.]